MIAHPVRLATPSAASVGELLPLVYSELRSLAAAKQADEKAGQTFQPTALVHEANLRLVGWTRPSLGGIGDTFWPRPPRRCGGS